jgi:DNA-binding NarL/FixJ family response regulator
MEWIKDILLGLGQACVGIGFVGVPIAIYKGIKHRIALKKLEEERRILELKLELEKQNNREIQKQVSDHDVPADVHVDMVTSDEQERILLLHHALFNQRDVELLQLVLKGEKYEYIASKQGLSLSSVKKRAKFLYDHLKTPDRTSFVNIYADCNY